MLLVLKEKIDFNSDRISDLKIIKPDVQCSLVDVVKEVARKGDRIDFESLTNALIEKFKENKDEFEIVLDEAIRLISKLTEEYMKFISSIFFLWLNLDYVKTAEDVENSYVNFNEKIGFNFEMAEAKKAFLSGLGLMNYITGGFSRGLNKKDFFYMRYNINIEKEQEKVEYTNKIFDEAIKNQAPSCILSPVGNLIAILYMKKSYPSLNPKVVI